MANSIALAQKYSDMLDEVLRLGALSTDLNANPSLLNFTGANTVKFPKMTVDGLGATDRNGDFVGGDVTLTYETHTLSVDRNRIFKMDPMDNEESMGVAFGMLAKTFITQKVIPELDAFRFARLFSKAGTTGTPATLTKTTVLTELNKAILTMDEKEVPQENRRFYMTFEVASFIEEVDGFDKTVNLNATTGNVGFRVLSYKGIPVIKVPQARFYTAITLYDGKTAGQAAGGYIKNATTGKDINFLLVHVPSVQGGVIKHNPVNVIPASMNQTGDRDIYKYRLYHDFFILDNKVYSIYGHSKA